jgi:hypothetical protein
MLNYQRVYSLVVSRSHPNFQRGPPQGRLWPCRVRRCRPPLGWCSGQSPRRCETKTWRSTFSAFQKKEKQLRKKKNTFLHHFLKFLEVNIWWSASHKNYQVHLSLRHWGCTASGFALPALLTVASWKRTRALQRSTLAGSHQNSWDLWMWRYWPISIYVHIWYMFFHLVIYDIMIYDI